MSDRKEVKCARCNCALQGPADPQPHDRLACPVCGEGDTVERVMAEVAEHLKEQMAQSFHNAIMGGARGSKYVKVTSDFVPKGGHRFVMDLDLH